MVTDYRQARLNALRNDLEKLRAAVQLDLVTGRDYSKYGQANSDEYAKGYGDCAVVHAEETLTRVGAMLDAMAGLWELS